MKISELIQALLDIQYLANEDVEITGSILDHYNEKTNHRAGVIMPQLVHHPISLEQICMISLNKNDHDNCPEEDMHYVHASDIMGNNWTYGEAPTKFTPMNWLEEENV